MNDIVTWAGITFCVTQSAMFSGLNLAFFSLSRIRLEMEVEGSLSKGAQKVLAMRNDSNFLLATILWGNVGINVLLTLLTDSVLAGAVSFIFSTVVITFFGEIIPQAYFSRNALKMASILAPVLRVYQVLLYPVAKPCALMLDAWLGKESIQFFTEKNIQSFIKKHVEGEGNEIGFVEGIGAINFFALDDTKVVHEGELLDPLSIIQVENPRQLMEMRNQRPDEALLKKINQSGKKWVVITNPENQPVIVIDADGLMRACFDVNIAVRPADHIYKPLIVTDPETRVGKVIRQLKGKADPDSDRPIKVDVLLYWGDKENRIITGADVLGRLLKGIGIG